MTQGIHHISTITSSAQKTYDFYTSFLGLRFIKKTVNFDAPEIYHLYFGDNEGSPGTALTFFVYEGAGTGMRGVGQITSISFSLPKDSVGYWLERVLAHSVKHKPLETKFGERFLSIYDFDGLQLELVFTDSYTPVKRWEDSGIEKGKEIGGFHSVTLSVDKKDPTERILVEGLGYTKRGQEEFITRYENTSARLAKYIDIFEMKGWPEGIQSAGTVHHVAFRVEDSSRELELIPKLKKLDLVPTAQIDRNYFKSVYFREPGGILFEIATDGPGFGIDEKIEELGTSLQLPEQYENRRQEIERGLPPLITGGEDRLSYTHKFIKGGNDNVLILLHGTGADESDLIPIALQSDPKASILSLRGDVDEDGFLRFFRRFSDGKFDESDIETRVEKLAEFILDAKRKYNLDNKNVIFLGFSNGANMIASLALLKPSQVETAILIRPVFPIDREVEEKSQGKILILSGHNDPYAPEEKVHSLIEKLKVLGFKIEHNYTGDGHAFNLKDYDAIYKFLKGTTD